MPHFIENLPSSTPVTDSTARDYPIQPVPFTRVALSDNFWLPRLATNRAVTIPFAFKQCEDHGRMNNFDRAAAVLRGEKLADASHSEFPFDDTDPFKIIEGAAYALAVQPDAALEAYIDGLIERIGAAQEPDGYLFTARTLNPEHPHSWAGPERWVQERELSHELYNLGHLYEAALAYLEATGKRALLEIALRTADLLDRTFGPGKQAIWPGHQMTEMGLVRLYRVTGEERYLTLARFLLDCRGPDGHPASGQEYNQSHLPVVQQREAVGHAVRATYMYAGMADVAAMTGDPAYLEAIDAIWEDAVAGKLYLTGGIGSTRHGEAFGQPFELPNMTAYNETCASIGNVHWNHRLFLLHGHGKYLDVMERTLYNGLLSGVALDGKAFFYPNPLESRGQHTRQPWFGCACCPSNICRFMGSLPGYLYAQRGEEIFVNLFAESTGSLVLPSGQTLAISQETDYPWHGQVCITLQLQRPERFTLKVRIPGWARDEVVPGGLYQYVDKETQAAAVKINGEEQPLQLEDGYASLTRVWESGDKLVMELPMPVRRVKSRVEVTANHHRFALQRGPLVYCLEWPDNEAGQVRNLVIAEDAPIHMESQPQLLGGVVSLHTEGLAYQKDENGQQTASSVPAVAVPYYAWANRGPGEMTVWIASEATAAWPALPRTVASTARLTATPAGYHLESVRNRITARTRGEEVDDAFFWWPIPDAGIARVQYSFSGPEDISSSSVFWFDDTDHGNCRVPQQWHLLYRPVGAALTEEWRPVELKHDSRYTNAPDTFNTVHFLPVTATALRLELEMQAGYSAGVEEWRVGGQVFSASPE